MKIKTRNLVMTAILSGIAFILMFVNFSVPFMPFFIKLDISELPGLLAAFSMGPWYGVAVCFIKNLLNFITASTTGGVGELSNFILGASFVLTAGCIYSHKKNKTGAILGSLAGSVIMGVLCVPSNYFITYPIYTKLMPLEKILGLYNEIFPVSGGLLSCLVMFNMPFTMLKGVLCSVITFLIYKRLSPVIKGR